MKLKEMIDDLFNRKDSPFQYEDTPEGRLLAEIHKQVIYRLMRKTQADMGERCAQIADPYYSGTALDYSARRIAEDIRALKEEV